MIENGQRQGDDEYRSSVYKKKWYIPRYDLRTAAVVGWSSPVFFTSPPSEGTRGKPTIFHNSQEGLGLSTPPPPSEGASYS